MDQLTVYGVALVPILVGLNELLKRTGVPSRFIPATSMAMGYFFAFYYLAPGDFKKGLLYGTILGLSSIGLFSGTKNTFVGLRKVSGKR
jgi:Kef-type K+ transport system membrane component KefB